MAVSREYIWKKTIILWDLARVLKPVSFNNAVFDDKRLAPAIIRIASFYMFSNLLQSWIDKFSYTTLAYSINGRIKFVWHDKRLLREHLYLTIFIRWILVVAEDTILSIWVVHCIFCVKVMPRCLCCFTFFSLLLFKIKGSSWGGCFLRENIIAIVFGMLIVIFHWFAQREIRFKSSFNNRVSSWRETSSTVLNEEASNIWLFIFSTISFI